MGARHFIVRLGKASSGARYDDLKLLPCEIQVRTVVQDSWAIIQHHMVYKRESQVPTQLQRKLNSLAGLFETVDDQFERIREEREQYVADVRDTVSRPSVFLENELNLDSFREYLKWKFPDQIPEAFEGQANTILDSLITAGYKTLGELEDLIEETATVRSRAMQELIEKKTVMLAENEKVPSSIEPFVSLALTTPNLDSMHFGSRSKDLIRKYRPQS